MKNNKMTKRKLKRVVGEYNKNMQAAKKAMDKLMQGGYMPMYADGGVYNTVGDYSGSHVNTMAPMFGANSTKISNMHSPLHAVNPEVLGVTRKAMYGGSIDSYGYGGTPMYGYGGYNRMQLGGSLPGFINDPVEVQTNASGMTYSIPEYQQGGMAQQQPPMPNSQDVATQMMQAEGMPMPGSQQQAMPQEDPAMQQQQMQEAQMAELQALAQAILQGDEEAMQIVEQLPEEQQQIIMEIIEQMEQGQKQTMKKGYGGSTKKKKKMKKGGYSKRKSSDKKLNKMYNTLGIPC